MLESELIEVNRVFDANCSEDGEEEMTKEQLKTAMRALGFEPRATEIQRLYKKYSNKKGKLVRDGFQKIMATKMESTDVQSDKTSNDEISKVFNLLDLSKTGYISINELRSIAQELNEDISEEDLEEMINEADLDGDSKINKEEFREIMKKTSLY